MKAGIGRNTGSLEICYKKYSEGWTGKIKASRPGLALILIKETFR
jgi:hypothetical protein